MIVVLFLRDIQSTGIILISAGVFSLIISTIFNLSKIKNFLISSKGAYGANTLFILIGVIIISLIINSVIYVSNKNGITPSWFRSDLTASKEYDLSNQAFNAIQNLNENLENQNLYNAKFSEILQNMDIFDNEERIECTILIRLDQQLSTDEFSGSISVQSSRPVFKTLYPLCLRIISDMTTPKSGKLSSKLTHIATFPLNDPFGLF